SQAIGKSRGGLTTKILALVDALGNLVRFSIMPGQCGETTGVSDLIAGISCQAFIGDKVYDADWLRDLLNSRGIEAVIPPPEKDEDHLPHMTRKNTNGDIWSRPSSRKLRHTKG
ncbi:MAG: transposase, partial [Cohaesibacter sp.]|nr:transposase [Cohaesibacter sp.]